MTSPLSRTLPERGSASERALGVQRSQLYDHIPQLLGTNVSTALAESLYSEPEFRNDTDYPMVIYGLGFSLAGAHAAVASQSYNDVAIHVVDISRNLPWTRDTLPPRVSTLIDLAGNAAGEAPGGSDIFVFNGTRWQFRYPTILPPNQKLTVKLFNPDTSQTVNLEVVALGALLQPTMGARFAQMADRLARSVPYGPTPRLPALSPAGGSRSERGASIIGYERVPHVLHTALATSAGTPQTFPEADLRNLVEYDFHCYEVGFTIDEALDGSPSIGMRDVSIRVTDVVRNEPWNKTFQRIAALLKYNGSIMGIGQGGVWTGVKWDLGPGTTLPPGGNLRLEMVNNQSGTTLNVRASFIGDVLVPVVAGTVQAEMYERYLRAVPAYW